MSMSSSRSTAGRFEVEKMCGALRVSRSGPLQVQE